VGKTTRASAWTGGANGAEAAAHRRLLDLEFAKLPLSRIDTAAVRQALARWDGMATSTKMRTKIKSVIDYAKALGWFSGDNPAAEETMGKLLPATPSAKHHEAMPWADVPAFMHDLGAVDTPAARALRFTILTAARSGETRGATWSEIQGDVWSIGAERMKEGKPHTVPLPATAIAVLGERGQPGERIFKSPTGVVLDVSAMLDYVNGRGFTVHGFRSSFVDWASEHGYPSELRELALAHAVGDQVERAYRRTGMIDQRRPMMQAWAAFATSA
jgi:integrase